MSFDYERQKEKSAKLHQDIIEILKTTSVLNTDRNETASLIFKNYIAISPPEKERVVTHFITASSFSGRGGGRSVKAGNIQLNIGKLLKAISSGVFTVVSVNAAPWAIPFAAILLWQNLWDTVKVDISELEVVVLIVLHRLKNSRKVVDNSPGEIQTEVNKALLKHQRSPITASDLSHALNKLDEISSIEKCDNGYFIREWIKVNYR